MSNNQHDLLFTKEQINKVKLVKFSKKSKAFFYALIALNIILILLTFIIAFSVTYNIPFTISESFYMFLPLLFLPYMICPFLNTLFLYFFVVIKTLKDCIKGNNENLKEIGTRKSLTEENAVVYFNKFLRHNLIAVEF